MAVNKFLSLSLLYSFIGGALALYLCGTGFSQNAAQHPLEQELEKGSQQPDPSMLRDEVPNVVLEAFKAKYPNAEANRWNLDGNGYWEAKFSDNGFDYRADFGRNGVWIETEQSIDFDQLPQGVKDAIKAEFAHEEINEIESVDNAARGKFYDVEFKRAGTNLDIEFRESGEKVEGIGNVVTTAISELQRPIADLNAQSGGVASMGKLELLFEFGFNLLSILIFAYVIYYRRHHDHKMLFLLLGFNLFLFPIFLLSSSLSAGFGFTIFALLALVRLRSDTFSKAEVAYLLGAVALTFINAMMPARVEIISTVVVLLTAWLGDHPNIWRGAYQTANIRYRIKDTTKMLDQEYLRRKVAEDFQVEVNNLEIERVDKNQVRLVVMYRDLPELREQRRLDAKRNRGWGKGRRGILPAHPNQQGQLDEPPLPDREIV